MHTKKKNAGEDKRDLSKFLEDQQKYLELKEKKALERKERAMQNEQSVMVSQPMVNEKSKRILEKKRKLIEEGGQEQQKASSVTRQDKNAAPSKKGATRTGETAAVAKKRMASPQPNETFKPVIGKKSAQMAEQKRQGQKIEDHLINEGKRLKEKMAKKEQDMKV